MESELWIPVSTGGGVCIVRACMGRLGMMPCPDAARRRPARQAGWTRGLHPTRISRGNTPAFRNVDKKAGAPHSCPVTTAHARDRPPTVGWMTECRVVGGGCRLVKSKVVWNRTLSFRTIKNQVAAPRRSLDLVHISLTLFASRCAQPLFAS